MSNKAIEDKLNEMLEKSDVYHGDMNIKVLVQTPNSKLLTGRITKYDELEKNVHIVFDNDDGYSKTVPKEHVVGIVLVNWKEGGNK